MNGLKWCKKHKFLAYWALAPVILLINVGIMELLGYVYDPSLGVIHGSYYFVFFFVYMFVVWFAEGIYGLIKKYKRYRAKKEV